MRAPTSCKLLAHALAIGLADAALSREPDGQELHLESRVEPQDLAWRHRDCVGNAICLAADANRHVVHAQHARARGHRLDQLGAVDLRSPAAKLCVLDEAVAQQRAFEDCGRRTARCDQFGERRAAQLRREELTGAIKKLGHDDFRRIGPVDDGSGMNESARRPQHDDPMHVLAQAAVASVDPQRLLNERVRRRAFTNARIRRGCIKQNIVETVDDLRFVRPPRLQPDVAKARNTIDQQLAKVVRRDRIARQDTAGHMQCVAPRVDAPVRAGEQVRHRKSGAIRQFG